jgi:membrane-bound serine protease (ClpP class)
VGQSGIVLTPLRPAGTIELEGRRLDVTANGAFIEAGKEVRVLAVNGSFITVERAE